MYVENRKNNHHGNSSAKAKAWATILADGAGAFGGGEMGEGFGLWGIGIGAAIGGIGGSCLYAFGRNESPSTPSSSFLMTSNEKNPNESTGMIHNAVCTKIATIKDSLYDKDNIADTLKMYKKIKYYAVLAYNSANSTSYDTTNEALMSYSSFLTCVSNSARFAGDDSEPTSLITANDTAVFLIDEYADGISSCLDTAEIWSYTEGFEDAISLRTDYSTALKNEIFHFLSTSRYSGALWYQ